ncbi:hypothetical protein F2Q70_00039621 [Brassica cretica]|uniref:Uncharacterized protein n=1 Tax=Brassica cretica TaxID=69181 RepID=A0A8S9K6N7_BRACR|nr:hypothetical protein F2Q70_00039621 [Brassica cretica]
MVAQRARIAALEVERDRDIRRASRIGHRDIAAKFWEVLESLKDRWASKKKEMSTEIRLQEEWKETARILSPPPPCRIGRSPSSIFLKSQMIRWIKSGGRLSLMILFFRANAAQLAAAEKLGNQAASLEARLRVVSNERKSALEQVSFFEAKVESSANKFSDDLRRAIYDAKKTMVDSYLDVLEIMNNNLLASAELLRLRAKEVELGSEVDVKATSDFSVRKLDLPQISEDLPEDFFAKVPSAADDVKCSGDRFEDGEFSIEE